MDDEARNRQAEEEELERARILEARYSQPTGGFGCADRERELGLGRWLAAEEEA